MLLSLNINLQCSTKLSLFQAAVQEERSAPELHLLSDPGNDMGCQTLRTALTLISSPLLLHPCLRLFAHRLTADVQSLETSVI